MNRDRLTTTKAVATVVGSYLLKPRSTNKTLQGIVVKALGQQVSLYKLFLTPEAIHVASQTLNKIFTTQNIKTTPMSTVLSVDDLLYNLTQNKVDYRR